jgi:hypothetical protein
MARPLPISTDADLNRIDLQLARSHLEVTGADLETCSGSAGPLWPSVSASRIGRIAQARPRRAGTQRPGPNRWSIA